MTPDELRARTAEDIRARYVECLARAAYERTLASRPSSSPRWDDTDLGMEEIRDRHRQGIAYLVDALAAAGLLPVFADCVQAYEPNGDPLDHYRLQFLTDWRDVDEYYHPLRATRNTEGSLR
jgi:hypothetical protein